MQGKALDRKGKQAMEERKVAPAGSFCWNEECSDYGQVGKGNLRKSGRTDKGVQRYQCKTCKKTWTQTKGTLFYRCRHSEQTIVECLAMVGNCNSLATIHRVKSVKEETVAEWIERAASHVHQLEDYIVGSCKLSQVHLEALWTYVPRDTQRDTSKRAEK